MSFLIEARPDLRRHLYRLLGIDARDRNLSSYDSDIQESVHYFIQQGLWNAQSHLITNGRARLWRRRWEISGWEDDEVTGARSTDLPSDFLRLDGDQYRSALYSAADERPWGQETSAQNGETWRGNFFWVHNGRLWVSRGANLPQSLYGTYFYRHPVLEHDETPLDFPVEVRPLIPAEAAYVAMMESWLPLDDDATRRRIQRNLEFWRAKAEEDLRPTRELPQHRSRSSGISTTFFGV